MPEDRPWYMDRTKINRVALRSIMPGPEAGTVVCKLLADMGVFYRQHQTTTYLLRQDTDAWRVEGMTGDLDDQSFSSGE